jgi:hypothetical protein
MSDSRFTIGVGWAICILGLGFCALLWVFRCDFDDFLEDFYLFEVFSMRKCVRIWIFSMRKIPTLCIHVKNDIFYYFTISYIIYIYLIMIFEQILCNLVEKQASCVQKPMCAIMLSLCIMHRTRTL